MGFLQGDKLMTTVTKKDVAKRTAKALNEKIYTTEKFVDSIFTVLREILSEADPEIRIEIRDFGVFEVKEQNQNQKPEIQELVKLFMSPQEEKLILKPVNF